MATSPDLTPYVNPGLIDSDAQAIFEDALERAQALLPGWQPREGNTEVVLLQALALEASELVFAVNRIPGAILMAVLGRLFGVSRDPGAPPRGRARFVVSDDRGVEVPVGTRIQLDVGGTAPLGFTTDVGLVIPPGQTTGEVGITADGLTTSGNGSPPGQRFDLVDALAFVDAVVLVTELTGGRDAEDPEAYLDRGVTVLRRLVSTLLLPEHFELAALAYPGVARARAVDLYDPTSSLAPGLSPGNITVGVLGPDGAPLTSEARDGLRSYLAEQSAAFLRVHVASPTITAVNVSMTVVALPGADPDVVQDNATLALQDHLNPVNWRWGGVVRLYELVALVANVPGVDYVTGVTTPTADVNLPGVVPLATAGTIAVAVATP